METYKIQKVIHEMAKVIVSKKRYRTPEQMISQWIENEYKKLKL